MHQPPSRQRVSSQRRISNRRHQSPHFYGGSNDPDPQPGKRYLLRAILVAVVLVGISSHVAWSKHVSAQEVASKQAQAQAAALAKQKNALYVQQLNDVFSQYPDESITVATASNSQPAQSYGSDAAFDAASTAKLITAADYLHHVEQGKATLNQSINGQTARHLLQVMVVNSDDDAWAALNSYLGHTDLLAYGNSIGFAAYEPDENTIVPCDLARLLQQLYNGQLLNASNRSLLLGYMAKANYRQYIVAAVPAGDKVYHKVGYDGDTINDEAIITKGQKFVVLVIMTKGNGDYDTQSRAELIHTITNATVAAYL